VLAELVTKQLYRLGRMRLALPLLQQGLHVGASGRWLVRNSCAEANIWTMSPAVRRRSCGLSRMNLSSTTRTYGRPSSIAAPPGEVRPPDQDQYVTRFGDVQARVFASSSPL